MKKFVILVGPSGCGKTAIMEYLKEYHGDKFAVVPSVTTRESRTGEANRDKQYEYVGEEEFQKLVGSDALLEHSSYAGNLYGTRSGSVEKILSSGRNAIKAMDLAGAINAKIRFPQSCEIIYILRPRADVVAAIMERKIPEEEKKRRIQELDVSYNQDLFSCERIVRNDGTITMAAEQILWLVSAKRKIANALSLIPPY